jgi:SAM-dependent methyltransferase
LRDYEVRNIIKSMSSSSRKQLESWLKTIDVPEGSSVIDIGAAQKQIFGRTKSWGENVIYKMLDLPKPHEGKVFEEDLVADIQDVPNDSILDNTNKFDIAFCLEVSEYWINPLQALKNIALLLRSGGTLYISFHFVYPQHEPVGEDCLRYTSSGVIRLLGLGMSGFNQIEITERIGTYHALENFYRGEGMKSADGVNDDVTGWLIKCKKI